MSTGSANRPQKTSLSGSLGAFEIAFITIASAGPLLIIAGVSPVPLSIGGVGAIGAQLISGVTLLLFGFGLARMAVRIRNAGAFYAYIGQSFGRIIGGGTAILAVFVYCVIAIGQLGAMAAFSEGPFRRLTGVDLPWQVFAVVTLAIVGYLGHRKITLSAKVLAVALFIEIAILLTLAIPVLIQGGAEGLSLTGFSPSKVFESSEAGAMFVLSFGAFLGFESTAIYSDEAKEPDRTVPAAIFIAVGFLTVFYTFMVWIVSMAYGGTEIQSAAVAAVADDPVELVLTSLRLYVGNPAVVVTEIFLITSTFASTLAFHNASVRYMFALGREHMLPARLATVHPKYESPSVANYTQLSLAVLVLVLYGSFVTDPYLYFYLLLVAPAILSVIFLQALCSFAVAVFFVREDGLISRSWLTTVVSPGVGAIVLSIVTWLVATNLGYYSGQEGLFNVVLVASVPTLLIIGVVRAVYMKINKPEDYEGLTKYEVY